ncbi:hypothetical protein FJU08_17875 [Martelella alba]|uniref:Uncharacterized protein n=1 Tax=Martelella alba TaxID=2590451 RepID=A0A506U468_9HYPH|nr:hypothetical protein [Martelella alba]TPW28248.1 hypothetical protein FJU08_17875 [Martelella alba]
MRAKSRIPDSFQAEAIDGSRQDFLHTPQKLSTIQWDNQKMIDISALAIANRLAERLQVLGFTIDDNARTAARCYRSKTRQKWQAD